MLWFFKYRIMEEVIKKYIVVQIKMKIFYMIKNYVNKGEILYRCFVLVYVENKNVSNGDVYLEC